MASINAGGEPSISGQHWLKNLSEKSWSKVADLASRTKKLGKDDPRRITHSFKVGLAITMVSLFYYFQFLSDDAFGVAAMWAVMTVVVIFEFSVGATLGRGVLRGLATFLGGSLGVGAHLFASLFDDEAEPILLGIFVFLLSATVTFIRFFPKTKARYDYGLMIFVLTFALISVSGYRDDAVFVMAYQRLSTILIGGATAVCISVFICPVWAGEDLHNFVATNLESLGTYLEGFGCEYFHQTSEQSNDDNNKASLEADFPVLNSKGNEETMVNFAKWEPPHGRFRYHHPWEQYLKIGNLTRQCAYRIEALNGHLDSRIQTSQEIQAGIQESCTKISSECGCTLKELAVAIRTMTWPPYADSHYKNAILASKELKSMLNANLWEGINLLEMAPLASVASLLIGIVTCTGKIADAVNVLASLADFKSVDASLTSNGSRLSPKNSINERAHHLITIHHDSPAE